MSASTCFWAGMPVSACLPKSRSMQTQVIILQIIVFLYLYTKDLITETNCNSKNNKIKNYNCTYQISNIFNRLEFPRIILNKGTHKLISKTFIPCFGKLTCILVTLIPLHTSMLKRARAPIYTFIPYYTSAEKNTSPPNERPHYTIYYLVTYICTSLLFVTLTCFLPALLCSHVAKHARQTSNSTCRTRARNCIPVRAIQISIPSKLPDSLESLNNKTGKLNYLHINDLTTETIPFLTRQHFKGFSQALYHVLFKLFCFPLKSLGYRLYMHTVASNLASISKRDSNPFLSTYAEIILQHYNYTILHLPCVHMHNETTDTYNWRAKSTDIYITRFDTLNK